MHLNSLTFNFSLTGRGSIENGKLWEKCVTFWLSILVFSFFDYQPHSLSLSMLALHSICPFGRSGLSMYGAWSRLQIVMFAVLNVALSPCSLIVNKASQYPLYLLLWYESYSNFSWRTCHNFIWFITLNMCLPKNWC